MMEKPLAIAAMSGGVDSSVAAALALERGFRVAGVTLKLLERGESGFGCCGSPQDLADARRVCERLGIPHYVVDMSALFEDKVIRPFVEAYLSARTPNPCVECNRSVKIGHLLGLAEAWGAEVLITGHYARAAGGRLYRAADARKDQSYFLYPISAKGLSMIRFPLGNMTKDEVRAKARELGLSTAEKPESMEVCFVPGRDYKSFVRSQARVDAPGPMVDTSGRMVGRHVGLVSYTVGQRKGLGSFPDGPRYVVKMSRETNTLVIGKDKDVYATDCLINGVHWIHATPTEEFSGLVQIRHRHQAAPARVLPVGNGSWRLSFAQPQRAITPSQSAVIYAGDEVLGGGLVQEVLL